MGRPSEVRLNRNSHLAKGLVYAGLGSRPYSKYLYDSSQYGDHFLLRSMNLETAWQRINTAKLTGRYGIQFDGVNDFVQSQVLLNDPNADEFNSNNNYLTDPSEPFSISFWVNLSSLPTTNGEQWPIITKRNLDYKGDPGTGYNWYLGLYRNPSGVGSNDLLFRWGSGFTYNLYQVINGAPSTDEWTHIVLTYKILSSTSLQVRIYKDGTVLSGTASGTSDPSLLPVSNGIYVLGTNNTSTYEKVLDGGLSDVMLYNRVLYRSDIEELGDGSDYMLNGLIEEPSTTTYLHLDVSPSPSISPSPSESPSVSPTPSPSESPSTSPSTPVAFNSISGVVWDDQNKNSIRDPGEPGLENYWVYIDLDDSCTIGLGEPAATTAADGTFSIFNPSPPNDIPAGTIIKIRMLPAGKYYSYPFLSDSCGAYYEVEATGDIDNINFGLTDTPLPSPSISPSISPSESPSASPSPSESPSISPSTSPSASVSPSESPSESPSTPPSPSESPSESPSASPSESPSVSPSPPVNLGYFSFLAFWAGGAASPREGGSGNLLFPEFDLDGSGTFVPWYRPSSADLVLPQFFLSGQGTYSRFPSPEPCIPCLNRSLLVSLYGWGSIDISTQFDFTPCAEELPESPAIDTTSVDINQIESEKMKKPRVKELKHKNKPK